MSNNKQIIITAPEGKIIDLEHFNKTKEVIFIDETPEKLPFPTSWKYEEGKTVYYIDNVSEVRQARFENSKEYHNCYPTEELAKQSVVLAQLILMREEYRRIELHNDPRLEPINWSGNKNKHVIEIRNNRLTMDIYTSTQRTFSFSKRETCETFLQHFSKAILYCKDLLS